MSVDKARQPPALLDIVGHARDEKLAVKVRVIPREDELLFSAYGGVAILEIKRKIFVSVVQIAPRLVRFLFTLIWCGLEKLIGFIIVHGPYQAFKKARRFCVTALNLPLRRPQDLD